MRDKLNYIDQTDKGNYQKLQPGSTGWAGYNSKIEYGEKGFM